MWRRRRESNNDPTSTLHRPHIDPTVDDYMRRLYGVDRRVLIGSRLFSSGPLSQKLQGFVCVFFTRRVPVPEPLLSHYYDDHDSFGPSRQIAAQIFLEKHYEPNKFDFCEWNGLIMSLKKNEGILFSAEIRVVGSYTDRLLSLCITQAVLNLNVN